MERSDKLESNPSPPGFEQDIDAMLERGVAALRASGRLPYEDDPSDRALVLAIVDAVFPVSLLED